MIYDPKGRAHKYYISRPHPQNATIVTDRRPSIKKEMSRRSNFVIMTYGVLNDEETVISAAGNHVIAVVNGPKSYDTLKTAFSTLFA